MERNIFPDMAITNSYSHNNIYVGRTYLMYNM